MKTTTCICDNCGKDITMTDDVPRIRILLECEWRESNATAARMSYVQPPFRGIKAFCDLKCLNDWLSPILRKP